MGGCVTPAFCWCCAVGGGDENFSPWYKTISTTVTTSIPALKFQGVVTPA
jgi:hypothetical protein